MRIASNKMLLNFGHTRSLGGSTREIGDSRTPSSESSLQRIGGVDLSVRSSGVLRLTDTRPGSPNRPLREPGWQTSVQTLLFWFSGLDGWPTRLASNPPLDGAQICNGSIPFWYKAQHY